MTKAPSSKERVNIDKVIRKNQEHFMDPLTYFMKNIVKPAFLIKSL